MLEEMSVEDLEEVMREVRQGEHSERVLGVVQESLYFCGGHVRSAHVDSSDAGELSEQSQHVHIIETPHLHQVNVFERPSVDDSLEAQAQSSQRDDLQNVQEVQNLLQEGIELLSVHPLHQIPHFRLLPPECRCKLHGQCQHASGEPFHLLYLSLFSRTTGELALRVLWLGFWL